MDKFEIEFMDNRIWTYLIESLKSNENNKHGYWTDGEDILCKTEEEANIIADFLEDLGFDCLLTGYHDPVQDEIDGCVDEYTGYWYIANY